jgi:hypothetical protein
MNGRVAIAPSVHRQYDAWPTFVHRWLDAAAQGLIACWTPLSRHDDIDRKWSVGRF